MMFKKVTVFIGFILSLLNTSAQTSFTHLLQEHTNIDFRNTIFETEEFLLN